MKPAVIIKDDRAVLTSRDLAAAFNKDHYNVIRDIEREIDAIKAASNQLPLKFEGYQNEFIKTTYVAANGKKNPMYYLTQKAFVLVAMKYEGDKATLLRLSILDEFERMERQLQDIRAERASIDRLQARQDMLPSYHAAQDAIKELIDYAIEVGKPVDVVDPGYYVAHAMAVNKALNLPKGVRKDVSSATNHHIRNICREAELIINEGIRCYAAPDDILRELVAAADTYAKKYLNPASAENERRVLERLKADRDRRRLERNARLIEYPTPRYIDRHPQPDPDYDFEEDEIYISTILH